MSKPGDHDLPGEPAGGDLDESATGVPKAPGEAPEAGGERDRQDELEEALREKDQFRALLQRTQADFVNFRRRAETQQDEARGSARRDLISRFLEAMDSLDAALKEDATSGVDERWVEGVRAIKRSFDSVLAGEGVEAFESIGERFDPRLHEAVTRIPTEGLEPDTVIDVVRIGYRINDAVLRPAMVVVAGPPETDTGAGREESGTAPE